MILENSNYLLKHSKDLLKKSTLGLFFAVSLYDMGSFSPVLHKTHGMGTRWKCLTRMLLMSTQNKFVNHHIPLYKPSKQLDLIDSDKRDSHKDFYAPTW